MEEQTYAGLWDGLVVDIKAPATVPAGSVKVRIPDIHGTALEVPDTALPWAEPNLMFAGLQAGIVGVPPINSVVNIMFKHGDKDYPVWIGGTHKTGEIPSQYTTAKQGTEPKGWGFVTPGGYSLFFDEVAKTVTLKTPTTDLYQLKIDATAQKVTLETKLQTKVELDDAAKKATVQTASGYKMELDETAQKSVLQTASGAKVEMDDAGQKVTLQTASGTQKVELTAAKAILTGALMEIGLGATEAAVLGTAFAQLWLNHGHPYTWAGTGGPGGAGITGGPVSPALSPGSAALVPGTHLSATVKVKN